MKKVLEKLNKLKDKQYAAFQAKLIPTVDKSAIIGVRTPELKRIAKEMIMSEDFEKFLDELPHKFFDENQLHAFILSEIKDYNICMKRLNDFLPYIDNWATCDQLSPKSFKKCKDELLKNINKWIKSKNAWIVRFAIGMLMQYFLDVDFDKKYIEKVVNVKYKSKRTKKSDLKISVEKDPEKYYVEMMRAWYFATALAKQYKDTLPYFKIKQIEPWTHNKAIQKAIESYRVTDAHKNELRKLKI